MANKGDLLRARQVSSKEGLQLASELGGTYYEVSARENCEGVHEAFQQLCQEVSRMIGSCNGEKRRGLHLVRPKSPNMQDLKRRLKQALTSKGKSATTLWCSSQKLVSTSLKKWQENKLVLRGISNQTVWKVLSYCLHIFLKSPISIQQRNLQNVLFGARI